MYNHTEYMRRYYQSNREALLEYNRQWRQANRQHLSHYHTRRWYSRPDIRAKKSKAARQFYLNNRDRVNRDRRLNNWYGKLARFLVNEFDIHPMAAKELVRDILTVL